MDGVVFMKKRLAVLFGCSEEGFFQKDILEFYAFLNSEQGGFWDGSEIAVVPQKIDAKRLDRILYELFSDHIDFLLCYFCGNRNDTLTRAGFTFGGAEFELKDIVDTAPHQLTIFDSCENFCSGERASDFFETLPMCENRNPAPANFFAEIPGNLFFTGCSQNSHPVLSETGSGVYTNGFLTYLNDSKGGKPDFFGADKNANFECEIARVSVEMTLEREIV